MKIRVKRTAQMCILFVVLVYLVQMHEVVAHMLNVIFFFFIWKDFSGYKNLRHLCFSLCHGRPTGWVEISGESSADNAGKGQFGGSGELAKFCLPNDGLKTRDLLLFLAENCALLFATGPVTPNQVQGILLSLGFLSDITQNGL